MRIGIQTWGTDGDIRPYRALATVLSERGHDVTLAHTTVLDRDPGADDDLPYTTVRVGDLRLEELDMAAIRRRVLGHRSGVRRLLEGFRHALWPALADIYAAGRSLAATHDVVVRHPVLYPVAFAAVEEGTPCAIVQPAPIAEIGQTPPRGLRELVAGTIGRRGLLAGRIVDEIHGLSRFQSDTGVSPPFRGQALLTRSDLTIIAASPHIVETPPAAAGRFHIVGQLDPPATNESLTAEILDFAEADGPVVLMAPGGSLFVETERSPVGEWLVTAARRAGVRAILQLPSALCRGLDLGGDMIRADFLPHAELMAHCDVIVHHGGAGTTHAAFRAGRPAVVVPVGADQPYWADRVHELGAGPAPVDFADRDPGALAAGIRTCLDDPSMAASARRVGSLVSEDKGPEVAAELIERLGPGG